MDYKEKKSEETPTDDSTVRGNEAGFQHGAQSAPPSHSSDKSHSSHHKTISPRDPTKLWSKYIPHTAVILLIFIIINLTLAGQANTLAKDQIALAEQDARLPALTVVTILDKTCLDCFQIQTISENLKAGSFNITDFQELDILSGQDHIDTYNIKKIPAIIISGDIEKVQLEGFEANNGALVLSAPFPPYVDTLTNKKKGLVKATILSAECEDCVDMDLFLRQVQSMGVVIDGTTTINWKKSDEIEKYEILAVPTVLLSSDFSEYTDVAARWSQVGTKESDGTFVLRPLDPPFINVKTGKLTGVVGVTYIVDSSCDTCVNTTAYDAIFGSLGLVFGTKKTVELKTREGQELAKKYTITAVPTLLFSKEAGEYTQIKRAWSTVGTVEDGLYILRNPEIAGPYLNLTTGAVVIPAPQR